MAESVGGQAAPATGAGPAWQSLVDAELAFARAASVGRVSDAFLQVLADDAVLFRPGPVAGRAATAANPSPPGQQLVWHPRVAAVSAAGDLGFTTGPFTFRAGPTDSVGGSGHFLSVWRKDASGRWRLALDVGVSHAPLADQSVLRNAVPLWDPAGTGAAERRAAATELLEADDRLSDLLGRGSAEEAATAFGTRETLAYRNGAVPVRGLAPLREAVTPAGQGWRAERGGSGKATSGDLGYTYGTWSGPESRRAYWVRVWRRTPQGWRLAACMLV